VRPVGKRAAPPPAATFTVGSEDGLDRLGGAAKGAEVLRAVESAGRLKALADLAESLHTIGHILRDSLESA
jgi:hypothetical protein